MTRALTVLAALCALLGAVLTGVPGMRFSGALCCALAALTAVYAILVRLSLQRAWAKRCGRVLLALFIAGGAAFLALEALVLSAADAGAGDAPISCVIVLGAGVDGTQPSLMLRSRLDAALSLAREHPEVPIIVTGCRGRGEDISEAECMYRYLTARGVAADRVWKEERATSTRTNFEYSYALMEERGLDPSAPFAFVTSDFHVCRAGLLAGTDAARGVPAHLPDGAYFAALTANYYIREAFALANDLLLRMDLDL